MPLRHCSLLISHLRLGGKDNLEANDDRQFPSLLPATAGLIIIGLPAAELPLFTAGVVANEYLVSVSVHINVNTGLNLPSHNLLQLYRHSQRTCRVRTRRVFARNQHPGALTARGITAAVPDASGFATFGQWNFGHICWLQPSHLCATMNLLQPNLLLRPNRLATPFVWISFMVRAFEIVPTASRYVPARITMVSPATALFRTGIGKCPEWRIFSTACTTVYTSWR